MLLKKEQTVSTVLVTLISCETQEDSLDFLPIKIIFFVIIFDMIIFKNIYIFYMKFIQCYTRNI